MGWFSDVFSPEVLLPIAAGGFWTRRCSVSRCIGTAALAGAATGGGIAALKAKIHMGAVTVVWVVCQVEV